MGLCKCPKRKVTNQFCFEHRVNVCEYCMVSSHSTCPVQSYLQWLQDSDYNPNCFFCESPLAGEECVRLTCYHLFRWSCLDAHCRSLPPDTAPAGYVCPIPGCNTPIFPPENLVSPVADKLRSVLQDVNWARAGLGLPLLSLERKPAVVPSGPRPSPEGEAGEAGVAQDARAPMSTNESAPLGLSANQRRQTLETAVTMDLAKSPLITGDPDSEGNKYRRRPPTDWLLRWWRTMMKPAAQRRRTAVHWLMLALIISVAFLTLVMVFNYLGRNGRDDPMLDPMNNPNIRIAADRISNK